MGIFGFGKKKETEGCSCGCGGNCTSDHTDATILILGSGCKNCQTLEENTRAALEQLGDTDSVIGHVRDYKEIAKYGIMSTPALVVDGKVLSYGKVLSVDEIVKLLKGRKKPKVAFVCVHNSCRSQIAEALGKKLAGDVFESYSAGTEVKDHINPDAVRLMKQIHNIDMEETQYSKLLTDIPEPDVVILMGCNVSCPTLRAAYNENWGLDDPSGKEDEAFVTTIEKIEENILALKEKLRSFQC